MVLVLVFNSVVKICGVFLVFFLGGYFWVPSFNSRPNMTSAPNKVSTEIGAPKMFVLTKDTS